MRAPHPAGPAAGLRAGLLAATLAIALAAGPAAAQVQQNDPNAANASFARQGELRALQQQRVSDFNTLNMRIQRDVQYSPPEPAAGFYGYGPRLRAGGGRGFTRGGPAARPAARGRFDTGVCVGC